MALLRIGGLSLAGLLLLVLLGCSTETSEVQQGVAPPYEPRSFDQVKPENVDLDLVSAPNLPEFPDCSGNPRNVRFALETKEYEAEIAPGITYTYLSFDGGVPGPAIVVCLGDWVEVTIRNPKESRHAHNVDFHAATGELGGASASTVAPGQQATFRFQALKEGAFVYHCAVAPIVLHVSSGMYGALIVLPRDGLPDVDKQFYLM